jgi:AGZA family xanthine/uracil permease-like MFS transporter
MRGWLERRFQLSQQGTTIATEVVAGATTFLTTAYIIFVQPAVLGAAGMDPGAVMVATCLSTAFASILMALLANYPIAVAPAMGHNFYFAYSVVLGMQVGWPIALGAVALAGMLFILTAGVGLRERVITAIPDSLKHAIAAGIGLLVAMVGLQWAGLVVPSPGTIVALGNLHSPPVLVALTGLGVSAVLMARRVTGALMLGIAASTAVGAGIGLVRIQGIAAMPPSIAPTLFKLDILGALTPAMLPVVLVFLLLALFDSVGTLVGVGQQAGLLRDGRLPRARAALLADAVGTVTGAALGTSTVTAYVESSSGVAAGGRTGLTSMVTAALFLLALLFAPLVGAIGAGAILDGRTLYPVIAPPLVLVGTMMMSGLRHIPWDDPTEAIPAFLSMIVMPLAVSITDGVAFGLIAYALLKAATGQRRSLHPLLVVCAALLLGRYLFLVGSR